MTDAELIEQYQQGSRAAFEELVRRHVNWVHSIAQRRVRDPHLADDVTQATFIVLARKAPRLKAGQALSTWLFPVANFASRQVLRTEHRRRLREVESAKMKQHLEIPESDRWNELSPMLDVLVGKLRRADRQAVLLRFYEQKSFPEIGQIMQISEEAARKRVSRAVEHLRESFARRGVAMGAAALATTLAANATQSVSAAAFVSAGAGSAPAALSPIIKSINAMLLWTGLKPLAGLGAGIILAAIFAAVVAQIAPPQKTPIAAAPTTAPATQPVKMHYGAVVQSKPGPVPPLSVWLVDVRGDVNARINAVQTTDVQGKFQFPHDPNARNQVAMVLAPGYGLSTTGFYYDTERDPAEIDLQPAARLRVKLVDMEGKPVAGVSVAPMDILFGAPNNSLAILPRKIQDELAQTTDADGVCTLDRLPRGAQVSLEVRDVRFAHPRYDGRTKMGNAEFTDAGTIKLKPGGSISGKVFYEDSGKPLAGLPIDVFPATGGSGNEGYVETDANGVYHIDQLSPGDYGIRPNWRESNKPYAIISYRKVSVGIAEQVTGKDMPLVLGGTLRGRVTAEATGQPVPDAVLMIIGPIPQGEREWNIPVHTDADGRYSASVPPGRQLIAADFVAISRTDLLPPRSETVEKEVAVGQTETVDFPLPSKPGQRVSGKVVDTEGYPLPGVYVNAEHTAPSQPRARTVRTSESATTDEQGQFSIVGANDGDILHARKGSRWMTSEALTINAANRDNLTIVMHKARWATLLVRAERDNDHAPIAGAKIQVLSNEDPAAPRVVSENLTSADGSCLIQQLYPDIKYTIRIWADGMSMGSFENVSLSPDKQSDLPPAVLSKAESSISGIVVDNDSQPIENVDVVLSGNRSAPQKVRTDVTGHFHFTSIMAGDTTTIYVSSRNVRTRPQQVPAGMESLIITFRRPTGL